MIITNPHIQLVDSFDKLMAIPFAATKNAICWQRKLEGDFDEIVNKIELTDDVMEVDAEMLLALHLSVQGQVARQIVLDDLQLLKAHGASPCLNIIKQYCKDEEYIGFATDVYSFHVDRADIPSATFLCTYVGAASEIVANTDTVQKIQIPEIREELKKIFIGKEEEFDAFLKENFYDLHYQATANASITNLGIGHLWRLAVDYPDSSVLPCIHRAPVEKNGEKRLLLIC